MTFGQRLKELRLTKGLTQRELAAKSSISYAYVSKLETGVMPPPRQKIILSLAKVLCLNKSDTDELFGLAKKMPSDLLSYIDTGMIKTLRSLKKGEETPAHELATLRRRIAELEASQTRDIWLKGDQREKDTFRAIVEYSPDIIVVLGSELEVLYENPSTTRILGYKPGEFSGKDTLGPIHPDDVAKAAHWLTKVYQTPGDTSSHEQLRVRHRDGTWRVFDVVGRNLIQNPAVNGLIVVMHEVSKRSRDEQSWAEDAAALAMAKEYHLTESEHKILILIAEGQSNVQIAEQLVVSPSTVRFHVSSILSKLGAKSRTEAATIAVRRHLVV